MLSASLNKTFPSFIYSIRRISRLIVRPQPTTRKTMRLLVAVCLVLGHVIQTEGHGRLTNPAGRASAWRYGFNTPIDYQDNEQFCGGREVSQFYPNYEIKGDKQV